MPRPQCPAFEPCSRTSGPPRRITTSRSPCPKEIFVSSRKWTAFGLAGEHRTPVESRPCEGRGKEGDIERLENLARYIIDSSLCGLGQTAPNPILTTIKYFRDEYEVHIKDKKCPAKKCSALVEFEVNPEKCTKCGLCFKACPAGAVAWEKKQVASIDKSQCTQCMSCYGACGFDAID